MAGRRTKPAAFLPLSIRFVLAVVVIMLSQQDGMPRCAAFNPRMLFLVKPDPIVLQDHGGALLTGNLTVNLLFYGRFSPSQRAILADFVRSLSSPPPRHHPTTTAPSVASWWRTTSLYRGGGARLALGRVVTLDEHTSLGHGGPLSMGNVTALARAAGHHRGAITAVLTAADVAVAPLFCVSRCGVHGRDLGGAHGKSRYTYVWVGNPARQCPGQCAWPFHQPLYGPQNPPLVPPNGDVGVDGMVISLAALLAGTVTNPYGDGYYQGDYAGGMEAATACAGIFGSGAYPGYPGRLLTDPVTGASYNAVGLGGRKYLLPALWDPTTSQCKTLV
nr:unnamed protein product [Digitaria exilis]